jgi:hypothetical protein
MVRSLIEPIEGSVSSENHSENPSSQTPNEAAKVMALLDSTSSYNDTDMNDGSAALEGSSSSPGQLTSDHSQTSYIGNAHWGAVLNEVRIFALPPDIGGHWCP